MGSGHHSHRRRWELRAFWLLLNGYDNGLRFFDAADSYGSHPHVAEALKNVPRDKVTVLSKTGRGIRRRRARISIVFVRSWARNISISA